MSRAVACAVSFGSCRAVRFVRYSVCFFVSTAPSDGVQIGVWLRCGAVRCGGCIACTYFVMEAANECIGKAVSRDVWVYMVQYYLWMVWAGRDGEAGYVRWDRCDYVKIRVCLSGEVLGLSAIMLAWCYKCFLLMVNLTPVFTRTPTYTIRSTLP